MNYKGQGAIEYLLIIGAAILVVAIVIIAITGAMGQGTTQGTQAQTDQNTQNNILRCTADCNAQGFNCGTNNVPLGCAKILPTKCKPSMILPAPTTCVKGVTIPNP